MREVSKNNFIDNSCLSKIYEEWIQIDKVSLKIWLPNWTKKISWHLIYTRGKKFHGKL